MDKKQRRPIFGRNNIVFVGKTTRSLLEIQAVLGLEQLALVAGEDEKFRADASTQGESKAVLLNLRKSDPTARGVLKAAVILLIGVDDLPSFLQKMPDGSFIYLPKISPVEWAIWMTVVKEALTSVGSAA